MHFIEWDDNLILDIKEIDDQHKELVECIDFLYEASKSKDHDKATRKALDTLFKYADVHFKTEEKYFKKFDYEGAADHIRIHEQFRKDVAKFDERFRKDEKIIKPLLKFLAEWVTTHVMEIDRKYVNCFHDHGLY